MASCSVLKADTVPLLVTALSFIKYVAPVDTEITFVPAALNVYPVFTYEPPNDPPFANISTLSKFVP